MKILYLFISILGVLMFIGLYFLVVFLKADYVKYVLMILGYISIGIFFFGYIKYNGKKEKK